MILFPLNVFIAKPPVLDTGNSMLVVEKTNPARPKMQSPKGHIRGSIDRRARG
jgi:hypothetical protein